MKAPEIDTDFVGSRRGFGGRFSNIPSMLEDFRYDNSVGFKGTFDETYRPYKSASELIGKQRPEYI